ncbi:RNA polymerase recycling motor ATPase HelR [Gordonia aichiensis]|uniref:RNA polymerase recycling motor ATPase HelR n=1 Tax=Gordonia aichiensis TaxID=36820 RepID=UPI003264390C
MTTDFFALPQHLTDKADPALIGFDQRHLARIAARLSSQLANLTARLDVARRSTDVRVGYGVERDQEIRTLSAQIRRLSRFGADLCLGRTVADDGTVTYIGRIGLAEADGTALLVDWRAPDAGPFFAATLADPMGLTSRRRYRWSREMIIDYWDESLTMDPDSAATAALDSQSSFIAALGARRSPTMTSVLGTIAADQDAAIRASSRGPLVVDGGPGTGKTVVALHRAAYLLYADPRLQGNRGRILVVGPNRTYLRYIGDVLPGLGEEGVSTCTLADLVPGGAAAAPETDSAAARLKETAAMVAAVEPAVTFYEEPPTETVLVETAWFDLEVGPADWAEAFACIERGSAHNEVRDELWEALLDVVVAKTEGADERVRVALEQAPELRAALRRAWPILDPEDLISDLWSVPAYLHRCAPWLTAAQRRRLRRPEGSPVTAADLPLLDAARRRLGDPERARLRQRCHAELRAQQRVRDEVVDELMAADDREGLVSMLRAEDIQSVIVDEAGLPTPEDDPLAGPFAHIVVDEAQDLTDAQWQMLLARCPSRSFTIVGDRAQARAGFTQTWQERMRQVGLGTVRRTTLSVNYRTPQEVMDVAAPAIRAAIPDVDIPTSIRTGGLPVIRDRLAARDEILHRWRIEHDGGTACVIGDPGYSGGDRTLSLQPVEAKGLEFDLVVLIEPARFGDDVTGAVDRYVSMTRTTGRLVILAG